MKSIKSHSLLNTNQEGSALVLVLLVTTVLLIIGTVTLNISAKTREASDLEEKKTQALYIAESGIYKNMGEIKATILTYLEEKAEDSTAIFNAYKINNASLNGGTYNLTVTLANAAANEFVAESVAYIKVSDGSDVKKTITMKFIPQDEDGEDVPSEPDEPSGGGGAPQLADVFEKYAVYSDGILKLTNSSAVVTGDVTTNKQIILKASSSIVGKAYFGSTTVNVQYENQAKITGGTQLISPPVSIPPVTDVTKLKPSLDSVGGTAGSGSEITSNKIIENKTFSSDITVEGKTNVRFNKCRFSGNILFRNNSSKIEFNDCVFEKQLTINDSAVLNNCIIKELVTSNTKELYVSGIVWLEKAVTINGPSIYTPTTSPLTISPNIQLNGAGVIISENKITFTNTVKANYDGTNIGIVSLYANLDENDPAISNTDGNFHGVFFAPKGAIKQNNSSAKVEGSVVGMLVSIQDSKVNLSVIDPKLVELLPGSIIGSSGGGFTYQPNIAGVKVTEWKEH